MKPVKIAGLIGSAMIATSLSGAFAQGQDASMYQRDRYTAVTDRYQEAFDPPPVRLGSFILGSQLDLGVEADDNVFASADNAESDVVFRIAPRANLTSDWSRHQVGATLNVDHREYSDFGSESATNLRGELRGRLDIARDLRVNGAVFASDQTEERRSIANLAIYEEPVQFQTLGGRVGAQFTRDRLRLNATVETLDYSYDDVALVGGGTESLSERDYTYQRARARVSYAISPDLALYGQGEVNARDYEQDIASINGPESRDAEGYALQVGADFELPSLIRGDVAIGYLEDNKDSDVFADVSGLSVEATLQWFPTQLTTVTFDAGREVIDPGLAIAGSATATDFGVRVDHELYRNWLLFGSAGLRQREYEDIDRDDDRLDLRLGATWKLNRRFHIDGYVERFDRDSSVQTGNFEQNVVGIALHIFP